MLYPHDQLSKEVAFIAYHFHWSKREILEMSHRERHVWVKQVSGINREINETAEEGSGTKTFMMPSH
jgi:hypothetical protein